MKDTLLRVAVTIAAGAVLHVLAPPINLHWLHWLAYLPMLWVVRADTPRRNRWLGYLYGVVGVALIFRWFVDTIILFSNIPWPLAWVCLLLFSMAFGVPYALLWGSVHPLRKRLGPWWILAWPALEVLIEYASMYLLLFPYQHGVSQYRVPYTFQLASLTGVWGVSYLLFFFNAALAEWMYRRQEGGRPPVLALSGAFAAVAATVLFGAWRYQHVEQALAEAPVVRAAQLQSHHSMLDRMRMPARDEFKWWVEATSELPPDSTDLVVWSEGACPYNLNEGRVAGILGDLAQKGGFEMVIGGGSRERREDVDGTSTVTAFNSVYYFGTDGEPAQRYDKMVPLPFGEYLPLADTFPWLADMIEGPGNFGAGEVAVTFDGRFRYASPICYEAILSYVCTRWETPDLFVNVTNDAWFGDTAAPHQHAMLAAVRAMELGVPVFRSAYSGVSMVIDPHGRISSETVPFTEVKRVVPVRVATFPTLYSKLGDWFVALCLFGLVGGLVATRRRE
jgi:apolipoprotein N-acyltransferase